MSFIHPYPSLQAGQHEDTIPRLQSAQRRAGSDPRALFLEARMYLQSFYQENSIFDGYQQRLDEISTQIAHYGTYEQSPEELAYGARVAWRNNTRCIGRLHWKSLIVRDVRHLKTAEEVFAALVEHLHIATNGGKIRSTISIFAQTLPGQPGIRIWNPQLIRYAGHRQPGGLIIGDPLHADLTDRIRGLGWRSRGQTPFDVLPLVIQMPNQPPRLFELPRERVLEVPLSHPEYPWFAQLGLKWHAVPVISNMRLEIGGLSYTAAPFNGWYMGTEIGARNLGDVDRYNQLPRIADCLGLDCRSDRTLWKDRALVELNIAVLFSFARHGVTIVDHHTASRQFMHHEQVEAQAGRSVPAHWVWLVPPISGSASPIFHVKHYHNTLLTPNFFYQRPAWQGPQ